jgi:HD-like signal output (HDOD) protein
MASVKKRIQNILQLVPFPAVAMEVVRLVDNPKTNAAKLGEVISKDQALAAKVLKVANSPFYGFPKQISTINFAIVVLGFETLKEIVLSVSLASSLASKLDKSFDIEKFWRHSLVCGITARYLARDTGYRVAGEAFIAGLLHDIGILILAQYFRKEYQQIVAIGRKGEFTFDQIERSFLEGATHCEVGAWLADRWNFPRQLVEAILYHHQPELAPKNPELTALVNLSETICRKYGIENIEYANHDLIMDVKPNPSVLEILKIDENWIEDGFFESYKDKISADLSKNQIFTGEQ